MRSLRKTFGLVLVLAGLSGLTLTVMVYRDPAANVTDDGGDPLGSEPSSSLDTVTMGLISSGLAVAGAWLLRAPRR
jgi:hypothetical protein